MERVGPIQVDDSAPGDKLAALCALGAKSCPPIDIEKHLQDFSNYAVANFEPDTFGIFVEETSSLKALSFFDRHGRNFERWLNPRNYKFPFAGPSVQGYLYMGFGESNGNRFEKHRHVFVLFHSRVESYLREFYLMRRHQEEMRKLFVSSIQTHARSIEAKDAHTQGHCDRVDRYAEMIARECRAFSEDAIFNLKVASVLHDIGKIGVRRTILNKPADLSEEETREIQTHSVIGGRIVQNLYGFNLQPIIRHHHERFDGAGYPSHLKGPAIPLESRIILIADTFDVLTGQQPYRRALSTEEALAELKRHAGTQFDPDLVRIAQQADGALDEASAKMKIKERRGPCWGQLPVFPAEGEHPRPSPF